MSCFFCNSVFHLPEYCNIYVCDESRQKFIQSKNYCLTHFNEEKCQDCHKFQKCYICYTTEHHTIYCPFRFTVPNLVVPNIDTLLIPRYLQTLNPCESLPLSFISPEASKLHLKKPIIVEKTLEIKPLKFETLKKFLSFNRITTVIRDNLMIDDLTETNDKDFVFYAIITNKLIVKARSIYIINSKLLQKEFLMLLSKNTRSLICKRLKLSSETNFSQIIQNIPNFECFDFYESPNIVFENFWPNDLLKYTFGGKALHFIIRISDMNFDVKNLNEFLKVCFVKSFTNIICIVSNIYKCHLDQMRKILQNYSEY